MSAIAEANEAIENSDYENEGPKQTFKSNK